MKNANQISHLWDVAWGRPIHDKMNNNQGNYTKQSKDSYLVCMQTSCIN